MALITNPIWRNTYYTADTTTVNYHINLGNKTIFSGKAVRYPDANSVSINIDKVCRNYLDSDIASLLSSMPSSNTSLTHPEAQQTFAFYTGSTKVNDYRFYNDWSYTTDKAVTGSSIVVSNPINGHFVPGMLKVRTVRTSNSSTSTVTTTGSASSSTGLGYTTQVKCAPYVLYYLNSYGGWDAFVIEGTGKKTDSYTTYQTDRVFNNRTLDFEANKYVQEVKTSYELNTGYLTDEQAANLAKNLVGSIKVYLQNIDEGRIFPVVIDDKKVTYQTYQMNGRKLCQYKIICTESQHKLRR